jgi:hypothetical protein
MAVRLLLEKLAVISVLAKNFHNLINGVELLFSVRPRFGSIGSFGTTRIWRACSTRGKSAYRNPLRCPWVTHSRASSIDLR